MSDYLRPEYTPLFTQVQDFIADQLNTDPQLSALGIEFLPEHRLDIEYEIKNNLGKQGTVGIVNTLKGTYGGHNGSTNAWEIEAEIDVLENPPVRRAQMKKMGLSAGSTADILDWVQESLCAPSSPTYGKFCAMSQELGEDRGIIVGRSIMKTFAIADVSAVVSGEHQWICPYALWSDLSALSGQVQDIVVELDDKRDKMDLSVYDYGAWSLYEYRTDSETGDPIVFNPPLQMEYRQVAMESWDMPMWITTSQTQPDTYLAISPDAQTAYELVYTATPDYDYTIIYSYTTTLSEDGTRITGLEADGAVVNCDARRSVVAETGDRLAKMSDLSSISLIPPYIEDADGNKIEADRTFAWREKNSWFVSEMGNGYYTYDPPLECAWGTYTIDNGLSQTQTQMWMSKTPYANNEYFGIGANLEYVEYYNKVGDTYVVITGDMIEEHTDNSITRIGLESCSITRTGEWSDLTATLATLDDLPTNTSDLTNDSGFITSAEVKPYRYGLEPTVDTGIADMAYKLAVSDHGTTKPVEGAMLVADMRSLRDLTYEFRAKMGFATYYPYVMTMYNGQTLPSELPLYFCHDNLRYGTSRPRPYYSGYMFRTGGAGFAILCDENGTPTGTLVETTGVQSSYVLMANNTTSVHSIGFSAYYSDPYGNIDQIDGQSNMIFARRASAFKSYSIIEELANKSELPTKTSDLTNDSGFITSAEVPTPDKIEDATGNKIEADLDCITTGTLEETWVVNGIPFTTTKGYTSCSYFPENPEPDDVGYELTLSQSSSEGYYDIQILNYYWANVAQGEEEPDWQWVIMSGGATGGLQEGATSFEIEGYTGTYPYTGLVSDKLATEGYVSSIIGDINTILDNINGEVI